MSVIDVKHDTLGTNVRAPESGTQSKNKGMSLATALCAMRSGVRALGPSAQTHACMNDRNWLANYYML